MSLKQMAIVWTLELDRPKQLVLLALANHADDQGGSCYPSVRRIAWMTTYSGRQVQRILRHLETLRLIERAISARGRRPSTYRLLLANGKPKAPFVPEWRGDMVATPLADSEGCRVGLREVSPMTFRGDTAAALRGDMTTAPEPSGTVKEPSGVLRVESTKDIIERIRRGLFAATSPLGGARKPDNAPGDPG